MAEALGYKNPRSVGNRLAVLKKVHGLGLITTVAGAAKDPSPTSTSSSPAHPNKVTKSPRVARKTRVRKTSAKQDFYSIVDPDALVFDEEYEEEHVKPTRRPRGRTVSAAQKPKALHNMSKERITESDEGEVDEAVTSDQSKSLKDEVVMEEGAAEEADGGMNDKE